MEEQLRNEEFNLRAFNFCEEKAIAILDPALDEQFAFIYLLATFCNLTGVNAEFTYQQIKSKYILYPEKEQGLIMTIAYCYENYEGHDSITIDSVTRLKAPIELTTVRKVNRDSLEGRLDNQSKIDECCKATKLKKRLIIAICKFCLEQCEYILNAEGGICGFEEIVNCRMEIVSNVLNDTLNYRLINSNQDFKNMDCNILWVFAQKCGYRFKVHEIDAWLKSAAVDEFDPIKEYFVKLPKWDGEDHISKLAYHIGIPDDTRTSFNQSFKKALIRNVGCGLGEMINRYVMVFSGTKQNTGKSTFIRQLCPPSLYNHYTESPLRGNKDDAFKLSETFIYNLEELSTLSARDVNELKAYISANSSNERKPYARDAKLRMRRTSFWASTNRDQFLVDDTGNTRWLIYKVDDIDWAYTTAVDINKVWAQAYHYYLNGEHGQLSEAEVEFQTRNNAEFEVRAPEHEYIMEYFRPIEQGDKGAEFYTNYQLLEFFEKSTAKPFRMNPVILGRAMKQLGFDADRKYVSGITHRGYWIKQVGRPNFKTGRTYCSDLPEGVTETEAAENEFFVKRSYRNKLFNKKFKKEYSAFHSGVFGVGEQ